VRRKNHPRVNERLHAATQPGDADGQQAWPAEGIVAPIKNARLWGTLLGGPKEQGQTIAHEGKQTF